MLKKKRKQINHLIYLKYPGEKIIIGFKCASYEMRERCLLKSCNAMYNNSQFTEPGAWGSKLFTIVLTNCCLKVIACMG